MPELAGLTYEATAATNRHPWTNDEGWLCETWRTSSHQESQQLADVAVRHGWRIWIVANVDPPGLVVYKKKPKPVEFRTTGLNIRLENGYEIESGWIDEDDPDALPAGDYLQVLNEDGEEVYYEDAADILADPIIGRRKLLNFLLACLGQPPLAVDPPDPKSTQPGSESAEPPSEPPS